MRWHNCVNNPATEKLELARVLNRMQLGRLAASIEPTGNVTVLAFLNVILTMVMLVRENPGPSTFINSSKMVLVYEKGNTTYGCISMLYTVCRTKYLGMVEILEY